MCIEVKKKLNVFFQGLGNVVCNSDLNQSTPDENLNPNIDSKRQEKENVPDTFPPTPPPHPKCSPHFPKCSPPLSVIGDDQDMTYPLRPQFPRSSSPMFLNSDEVCN